MQLLALRNMGSVLAKAEACLTNGFGKNRLPYTYDLSKTRRSLLLRRGAQVCGQRPDFSQKMHSGGVSLTLVRTGH